MTQVLKLSLVLTLLIITHTSPYARGESPVITDKKAQKTIITEKKQSEKATSINNSAMNTKEWTFTLSLTTPHPGWKLSVDTIYKSNNRVGILANVATDPQGLFPQVISKQEKTILINSPQHPVTVIITGKTWGWANPDEPYLFVNDLSELTENNKMLFRPENKVSFKIEKSE